MFTGGACLDKYTPRQIRSVNVGPEGVSLPKLFLLESLLPQCLSSANIEIILKQSTSLTLLYSNISDNDQQRQGKCRVKVRCT